MTSPFGDPVALYTGDDADGFSNLAAHEDMDLVRRTLLGFNEGGEGFLRLYRPKPTAAFSPRDTTLPAYQQAAEAMRALGFAPVERRAGGQFAAYDGNVLIIDLVAPHPDPREHVLERFRLFSAAIAAALSGLGIDARVGSIEGEYCPGDYSVNEGGRLKLAGVAQRIGRRGFHMGAVVAVNHSEAAAQAVATAYDILGMPFDPTTFGSIAAAIPGVDVMTARTVLLAALVKLR